MASGNAAYDSSEACLGERYDDGADGSHVNWSLLLTLLKSPLISKLTATDVFLTLCSFSVSAGVASVLSSQVLEHR